MKAEFDGFAALFTRFLEEQGPSVQWEKIEKLHNDAVRDYKTLETPTTDVVHSMLQKLVVVKLNGGLGTSMGCHGPKSVIAVRNDLTFLDLTVQQIEVSVYRLIFNCYTNEQFFEEIRYFGITGLIGILLINCILKIL